MDELQKLDVIRERMDVNYEVAKEALDEANGDLVQALVVAERRKRTMAEDVVHIGAELVNEIEGLSKSGPVKRIRLRLGDRVVKDFPVALTGAAAVIAALAGVLLSKLSVEVEREE